MANGEKQLWDELFQILKKSLIAPALKQYRPNLSQSTGVVPSRNTPSATTVVKGGITLARDLGGTSSAPLVVGLQGRDLASTAPTNGQAVVWNNGASRWEPGDVTPASSGYATTIGDGTTTSFTITHNLGTRDVVVQVHKTASTYDYEQPDIQATTINTITVIFTTAPATNSYRVIVGTGGGVATVSGNTLEIKEVDGTPDVLVAAKLIMPNGTLSVAGSDVTYTPSISNPMTTQDDIIVGGSSGTPTRLAKGSDSQVLTVDPTTHHLVWATPSAGFSNPMTTEGDLIRGGSSGTPTRVAVGSSGKVLTSNGTDPVWGDGPMTTRGDIITAGASGAIQRLALGASGKILSSDGTDAVWGNGPMTAAGDLIKGGTSGAPARLAIGTDGQLLVVSSGAPIWQDVDTAAALTLNNVRLPFDRPPTSAHAKDDEFTGTSLDGKWTSPITSACGITTTVGSHWLVLEPSTSGTGSTSLRGGFGIYQVSPTGSFTVSAKIVDADRRGATGNTDDGRTGIFVARTASTLVYVLGHQSSAARNANVIGCATYNEASTAWGAYNGEDTNTATLTGNVYNATWYKIVWDSGASTLTFYWSPDGVSWRTLQTISSASQPNRIGLAIYGNSADIRADHQLCCDWFRVTEP